MGFQLKLNTELIDRAVPVEPLLVGPDMKVRDVFQLLKSHNRGDVLVCEADRLVGIFTERDALRLMAEGADLSQPVSTVMIPRPKTLTVKDTVGKAITMMSSGGYRRLPIVDSRGSPRGVLKVSGILHYLVEHFPKVVYNLPPDPAVTQEREGA